MLQVIQFTRKCVGKLSLSRITILNGIHTSAIAKLDMDQEDTSELSLQISDNILYTGLRYLKYDKEKLKSNFEKRRVSIKYDDLVEDADKYKECLESINNMRRELNLIQRQITKDEAYHEKKLPEQNSNDNIHKRKGMKQLLQNLEERNHELKKKLILKISEIPNFTHPDVLVGGYESCQEVHRHGEKPEFSFPTLDHMQLSKKLGNIIDFDTGNIAAGKNFYYLKGAAALLELALIQYSMQKAISKGYHPVMTPDLIKSALFVGCGFKPRGDVSQAYRLYHKNGLCLTGTSELPLAGMLIEKSLALKKLPMRFVAFGRCFRAEPGGYGQVQRGLYRVHQFSKVELFSFTANQTGTESEEMLQEILSIQKEIAEELGYHYRILEMATEELGAPAYHKYDLEAWMPGRDSYGEVSSASNCTDFQSQRLRTTYHNPARNADPSQPVSKYPHTVNGTACAIPRTIIALLENHQQEDGSVVLPEVLHPFLPQDCRHIKPTPPTRERSSS